MVNKVILVGNVGKEPDVRHLDSGGVVAKFSLATNETYTNKEGKKVTQTEWHNIELWDKLAEITEKYVKVGKLLYIEGKARTKSYEGKDGQKKYISLVQCEILRFLGSNSPSEEAKPNESNQQASQTPQQEVKAPEPDDLPF